jgi:hypothetical protein
VEGRQVVATGTILYPGGTISDVALVQRWWGAVALDEYEWFRTNDILVPVGEFDYGSLALFAPTSVGISEAETAALLTVAPNPATVDVFVDLPGTPGADRYRFHLTDATGRIMRQGEIPASRQMHMDISDLSNGEYILRVSAASEVRTARMMVLR